MTSCATQSMLRECYAEVVRKLGLIPAGGNYVQLQSRIVALAIDVSPFTGRGKLRVVCRTVTRYSRHTAV